MPVTFPPYTDNDINSLDSHVAFSCMGMQVNTMIPGPDDGGMVRLHLCVKWWIKSDT